MAEQTPPTRARMHINPPVFLGSAVLIFTLVVFAVLWPETANTFFGAIQQWVIDSAGWFYIMTVAIFLVFVVVLALSDYGRIKLGPDHSQPDYSYRSWFAMLFSAGMGIGLMFFGVAEPIMHFVDPPVGEGGNAAAAREAMKITFFHWGIHAWAIYAIVALSLAYFAFRHNLPLTIRSAFYPLIGDRIYGPVGHLIDIFAVFGTMFGVATSLGLGVMQVNSGLNYLFGVPSTLMVQVLLIAAITGLATLSVALGLDNGIRRISELNLALAVILMVFVLIVGPTVFLLQTLMQNTGAYLSDIVYKTFNLYAYQPSGWIGGWTLFYWGWWIAWSPFVGMFIARISRGRTIREFVIGVLLVPTGFTFIWMTFFGDSAIYLVLVDRVQSLADAVQADSAVALFQFLDNFPLASVSKLIATTLVITFFVTSADSGALVIDMLTAGTEEESPTWQRCFWAILAGTVAAALLVAGGLSALQTATIASALPFAVIMLFMCWGLFRALNVAVVKKMSLQNATLMPSTQSWQQRLRTLVHLPGRSEVVRFIRNTVRPAMDEVAAELQKQNLPVEVEAGEDGRVWIRVHHGEEYDFFYSVRPRPYHAPSFVMNDTTSERDEELKYFRAEVHLREGGQDYDVMGWSKQQVITDIIDHYEKHMHFLNAVRQV